MKSDRPPLTGACPLPPGVALTLVAAPGLVAGSGFGDLLRRHRLAWSWSLLRAAATAPVVLFLRAARG